VPPCGKARVRPDHPGGSLAVAVHVANGDELSAGQRVIEWPWQQVLRVLRPESSVRAQARKSCRVSSVLGLPAACQARTTEKDGAQHTAADVLGCAGTAFACVRSDNKGTYERVRSGYSGAFNTRARMAAPVRQNACFRALTPVEENIGQVDTAGHRTASRGRGF
jgi:hypothetical protein